MKSKNINEKKMGRTPNRNAIGVFTLNNKKGIKLEVKPGKFTAPK